MYLLGHATPLRSSPRLHTSGKFTKGQDDVCNSSISVTTESTDTCTYKIFVTASVKQSSSAAEGPVCVVHDVPQQESLKYIKRRLRQEIEDVCLKAGLYWLPKRGMQCHTLNTESDPQIAKDVYRNSRSGNVENMRLAVVTLAGNNFLACITYERLINYSGSPFDFLPISVCRC